MSINFDYEDDGENESASQVFSHENEADWVFGHFGNQLWFTAASGVTLDPGELFEVSLQVALSGVFQEIDVLETGGMDRPSGIDA